MSRKPSGNVSTTIGVNRRRLLQGAAGLAGAGMLPSLLGKALAQSDEWTLAISMRSLANPYHATFANAGKAFAESIGGTLRDAGDRG